MSIPQHYLHVYKRPAQGSAFLRRYPVYNYKHTISAQGGFDTASCDIAAHSLDEGLKILDDYLGARVAVIVDNPCEPAWEGLINRMTFNSGDIAYTISLDEMTNRVSVTYNNGADTAIQTTLANTTASQAIYGIKQDQIEFGANAASSTSHPNALRDTILAQRAFPQTSIRKGGGNTNLVSLELVGMFHTLEWEKLFIGATAATSAFDVRIKALIAAEVNTTTFYDNTDTTKITANALVTPQQERAMTYWETIMKIAEGGDGTNYWVCGVTPTDWNTGKRVFYYQQSNAVVQYLARAHDGLRLRNLQGKLARPWTVRPDCGIMVTDIHIDFNATVTQDPRITYVKSIQYDANTQEVQYFGDDDTTARAAFMLKRGFKSYGRQFTPIRIQVA